MAAPNRDSFDRVFSKRDLFRGKALAALGWSVLGTLLVLVALFILFLVADLLDTRGRVEQVRITSEAVHVSIADTETAESAAGLENQGIRPSVLRTENELWGPVVRAAYERIPPLQENSTALMTLLAGLLLVLFIQSLIVSHIRALSMRAALGVVTRLRRTLHRQTLRLGPGEMLDEGGGQVIRLFTEDVERIREGITLWVSRIGRHAMTLVLLLAVALVIDWWVALQCLIPLAACWFLVQRARQRFEISNRLIEARGDTELRLLAEALQKTRIVRGYGMEAFEHEQFQKHLQRYHNNQASVKQGESWSWWISWLLVTVTVTIVLFLVGSKVVQTPYALSLAEAIVLLVVFAQMHWPLDSLWRLREQRLNASLAADRIFRYLDRIPEVSQAVGAKFLDPLSKTLRYDAVGYSLPNRRRLLDGVDLKINVGDVVAIVSTDVLEARALAYLLPRFIEPDSGRILIDGEDIAWVTLESLRAETVYVGGAEPFFTGTVFENISCGNPDYTLQDVTDAAKTVHAHNFIVKLAQGYETMLGEHGENLNPGQAFRLSLARAVLRDPALVIIEEPTEPLDEDTKSLLDDAYNRITVDRTVIFLPSRLSTLRRANRIVLVHKGKVESEGAHAELVRNSSLYRHWEYVHFNEFRRELEPQA